MKDGHTPMKTAEHLPQDATDPAAALSTPVTPDGGRPLVTTAREILPAGVVDTDHDLWLAERSTGLGGSELAAVLGLHPWLSPYKVWLDKTGQGRSIRDAYAMRRGRYYEPALCQWFADETGLDTYRTGTWARTDAEWQRVNPDRFTSDGAGLEVKMPASEWAAQWKNGPALYAVVQALWGCHVTGLPRWYLAADVNQGRGAELPIWALDVADWAERLAYWVEVADWWWHRYVVAGKPPPVDGSEATAEALNWAYRSPVNLGHLVRVPGLRVKVAERARLKQVIKDADGQLTLVENWIKAALAHDETGCDEDDVPVIAWRPCGTDKDDPTMPAYRRMAEIKPKKPRTPRGPRTRKAHTP